MSHASTSAWVVRAPHRPHCQSAPSSQTGLPCSSPYGSAVQRSQPAGHDAHRRKPPQRSFSVGSVQRAHAHVKHLALRSSRCRMYLMREAISAHQRSSTVISGHQLHSYLLAIRGNQRSSTVISAHQRSSAPLVPPRNQRQSALISGHHCHQDAFHTQSSQTRSRRAPGAIQTPSKRHRASTYVGSSVAT